jgi:N-acetylmuramoyl-L-alanine amidase
MCNCNGAARKSAVQNIIDRPSPNFNDRRGRISFVVEHYTAMNSAESAIEWLCNPKSQVSSHYVVGADGKVYRLVAEDKRAWHAGVGSWDGKNDINSLSVGIEIDNTGDQPYPQVQMDAVAALTRDIVDRYNIPANHVIGHSDVAPSRKQDPGSLFNWRFLAAQGLGVWPSPNQVDYDTSKSWSNTQIQNALTQYGYGSDDELETVLTAFQRHFHQEVFSTPDKVGKANPETLARLACLVRIKPNLLSAAAHPLAGVSAKLIRLLKMAPRHCDCDC